VVSTLWVAEMCLYMLFADHMYMISA